MTSPLQAQSNARNAQHATGPVTEEGKARSARNALRHGYCAADIVMPGEDAAQFEGLLAGVQADWRPASQSERELTDEIAVALWRGGRLRRPEAGQWGERLGPASEAPRTLGEAFAADSDGAGNAIEKLRRWWQGNERHLNRCTDKLALIKRLAQTLGQPRPPEEVRERGRHAAREIDLMIDAPLPGEGELPLQLGAPEPTVPQNEIRKSAEQTQSNMDPSDQGTTKVEARPTIPVTQNSAVPVGLPRKERRALLRRLAKEQRQQEKAARQAAAA